MLAASSLPRSVPAVASTARKALSRTPMVNAFPLSVLLKLLQVVDALFPSARFAQLPTRLLALFLDQPTFHHQLLPATTTLAKISLLPLRHAVLAATFGQSSSCDHQFVLTLCARQLWRKRRLHARSMCCSLICLVVECLGFVEKGDNDQRV